MFSFFPEQAETEYEVREKDFILVLFSINNKVQNQVLYTHCLFLFMVPSGF